MVKPVKFVDARDPRLDFAGETVMQSYRTVTLAAIGVAASLAFIAPSRAQAPQCQVIGNWAGWGTNGAGTFDLNPGQACTIGVNTFGTIQKTRIAREPQHGKVTQIDAANFEYRASPGFTGTDSFVIEGTGHDPSEPPGLTSAVTMTVNVR
jgi:hypothetical protein